MSARPLTSKAQTAGRMAWGGASCGRPLSLAILAATAAFWAGPAAAHDYEAVFHTMEECTGIPDVPSRVACYDRTMAGARAAIGGGEQPAVAVAPSARQG